MADTVSLTILHTNDIHGRLEGLAHIPSLQLASCRLFDLVKLRVRPTGAHDDGHVPQNGP